MSRKFHYETDPGVPTDVGKDLVRGVDRAREDVEQIEPVRPGGEVTPVPPVESEIDPSPAPPVARENKVSAPAGIAVVPLRTQKLGILVGVAIAACVLFLMALVIKPLVSKKDPSTATSTNATTSAPATTSASIPPIPTPTVSTGPTPTVHPSGTAPTAKPSSTSPATSAPALSGWKIEN
jgi:hypothetical protein